MASAFPGSPRVLKGALVVFETPAPVPTNIIAFQFNPDNVSRRFQQQMGEEDPYRAAGDSMFVLPPTESLSMTVDLDAADQLAAEDPVAMTAGLHPTLAALELFLYPSSIGPDPRQGARARRLRAREARARAARPARLGSAARDPGARRVGRDHRGGVRSAAEPDPREGRARLRTLTERELSIAGPPFDTLAFVNLIAKEVLARGAGISAIADVAGSASFDFL